MRQKLAVSVISGFLGAGKTTLINRLLASSAGRRVIVLVNDFGAINIDEQLIESRSAGVVALANGCICCSLQSNLVEQVEEIVLRDGQASDQLLIETSGVSDPGEILRALGYPRIRERIAVSSVATVVDATQFSLLTAAARQLAERQVLAADLALISKLDTATADQARSTRAACEALGTRYLESPDTAELWEVLFAMEQKPESSSFIATPVTPAQSAFEHWSFSASGPYGLKALRETLASLPPEVYRVKGFACFEEVPDAECVVQVVGDRVEISRTSREPGETQQTLVFIGARRRIDWAYVAERLRACVSTKHLAVAVS